MAKINTAERVSVEASDNFVFQRSRLAYCAAAERIGGEVLEIGTGSGYMAALIGSMAKQVTTIEIEPALVELARANLHRAGFRNVDVSLDDGSKISSIGGTFDAIVLSGSVHEVPAALLEKLNEGGRLVAFVGDAPIMRTTVFTRTNGKIESRQVWDTVVARLKGFPEAPRFKF